MKEWVMEFLLSQNDKHISRDEYLREIAIPEFACRRLAASFRIITPAFYDRFRIYWLIGHTLSRLPEDVFLTVKALNTIFLCSDNLGGVTRITEPGALIVLSKILSLRDALVIATIGHEFGHIISGELFGLYGVDDSEYHADDLACQWGFQEEISAIRAYYDRKEKDNGKESRNF